MKINLTDIEIAFITHRLLMEVEDCEEKINCLEEKNYGWEEEELDINDTKKILTTAKKILKKLGVKK